jgi:hypothetical protein
MFDGGKTLLAVSAKRYGINYWRVKCVRQPRGWFAKPIDVPILPSTGRRYVSSYSGVHTAGIHRWLRRVYLPATSYYIDDPWHYSPDVCVVAYSLWEPTKMLTEMGLREVLYLGVEDGEGTTSPSSGDCIRAEGGPILPHISSHHLDCAQRHMASYREAVRAQAEGRTMFFRMKWQTPQAVAEQQRRDDAEGARLRRAHGG